ncbi:MAG TPA: DedA family protein [Candidatus Acidoferrum sp.]|nr:DedA family protein [Candidatus Acidoferrum sp.]
MFSFIDQIQDAVTTFLGHQIYLAPILLLTIEEAGLPLPISDYIIVYTGYRVSQGYLLFIEAFAILTVADLVGVSILYFLCTHYGPAVVDKLGKFIDLDEKKLEVVGEKFRKYGLPVIIFGRHVPGLRIPITVFAGISGISYRTFMLATVISISLWIPFYLYVGENVGPRAIHLLHANGRFGILLLLPVIFTVAPFFFLRKKKPSKSS